MTRECSEDHRLGLTEIRRAMITVTAMVITASREPCMR